MARKFRTKKWDIKEMLEILKEKLKAKETSMTVGISVDDTFEKNHSTSALQLSSKISTKNPCVFCHKNNHVSNRCLKISEPSARKLFVKDDKLINL